MTATGNHSLTSPLTPRRTLPGAWLLSVGLHLALVGMAVLHRPAHLIESEGVVAQTPCLPVEIVLMAEALPSPPPESVAPAAQKTSDDKKLFEQALAEITISETAPAEPVALEDAELPAILPVTVKDASRALSEEAFQASGGAADWSRIHPPKPDLSHPIAANAGGHEGGSPVSIGRGASGGGSGGGQGSGTGSGNGFGTGAGSGTGSGYGTTAGVSAASGRGHGTGSRPPRPQRMEKGAYPADARRKGVEGTLTLDLEILESGKVGRVEVARSSGYSSLDVAACDAARLWSFLPAEEDGRAVSARVQVRYSFKLTEAQ